MYVSVWLHGVKVKSSEAVGGINVFMLLPGSEDVLMDTEPKAAEPVGNDSEKADAESDTDAAANTSTQDSSISNGDEADDKQEMVELKIIWNKNKYDLKIPVDNTGAKLKESIHSLTGTDAGKPPRLAVFSALTALCALPRSSSRHAESDVQRFTPRGQDATRHQDHKRCQNHGGGLDNKRRVGGEYAQRGHPAGGQS